MFERFTHWLSTDQLRPQGIDLIGRPELPWLSPILDSLIILSCYSIPLALIYFVRRRTDLAYRWLFLMLAVLIFAFGAHYLSDVWTLQGWVKAVIAAVSLLIAFVLWPLIPKALAFPSPAQWAAANAQLREEILERREAVAKLVTEAAERERTEARLRESEARLRTVLETAAEGIITMDEHGSIETFNPAAARMFGYASEEAIGQNVRLLMPFPYREAHDGYLARYSQTGEKRIIGIGREVMGQRNDGSVFPLEIAVSEFESGGRHFTGILRDITERKEAERILKQSERHFRTLCDTVPAVIWMSDLDGHCAYVNKGWIEFTGKTLNHALGEGWLESVHPDDREHALTTFMEAFAARKEYSMEFRRCRTDGEFRWILDTGVPLYTPSGRFAGYIGSCIDITERKQAEDQVRRSERRYQTLVHASPVGIFQTDAQGECIYVNERWCEIAGMKAEEARGGGWAQALHPEDRERIAREWYTAAKEHRLFKSVYRFRHPEGRVTWVYGQATGEEFETGETVGYVGTVTDMTEQKQIEQRLLQQQAELCHAQRLSTVGELAGVMAHELNQPLGAIANYLEGITLRFEKELASHPELGEMVERTLKLSESAAQIVRNIRALVRKQDPNRQRVDINALIRETVRLLGPEVARRQIRITLDLAFNIQPLWGHRVYLQQLLVNLILNGMEAMEAVNAKNRRLILQTLSADRAIEIRITDTGVGFAEELTTRLFEPFMTTKKEGVGLGLSICRTIAEAHGGEISADSRPGEGATFRVTLPIERRSRERDPH